VQEKVQKNVFLLSEPSLHDVPQRVSTKKEESDEERKFQVLESLSDSTRYTLRTTGKDIMLSFSDREIQDISIRYDRESGVFSYTPEWIMDIYESEVHIIIEEEKARLSEEIVQKDILQFTQMRTRVYHLMDELCQSE
jgi:hypothetical protein